jgi:hypothetical protein
MGDHRLYFNNWGDNLHSPAKALSTTAAEYAECS